MFEMAGTGGSGIPAIVAVAVNVQDLLALDTQHTGRLISPTVVRVLFAIHSHPERIHSVKPLKYVSNVLGSR